jgi:hypothetical protein
MMKRRLSVWVASLAILISFHATEVSATLFVSGGNAILYTVDPTSGDASPIGFVGIPPFGSPPNVVPLFGMSFSPSGTLFGLPFQTTNNQLWTVQTTATAVPPPVNLAAVATNIGNLGAAATTQATGLAFSPSGTLYTTAGGSSGELLTVNTSTGVATAVGAMGLPQGQLAFAPDGTLFLAYAASTLPDGEEVSDLAQVNPLTGLATTIGPIGFNDVFGLGFLGNTLIGGATVSGDDTGQLIDINTTTGAGTFVAVLNDLAEPMNPDDIPIDSLAVSRVPEPSTLPLLLSGLALAGLLALRATHRELRPIGHKKA